MLEILVLMYIWILQNDFNFEKKDWMTVKREELQKGAPLVKIEASSFK